MLSALDAEFTHTDILVMSAAVADARPEQIANAKIKKNEFTSIALVENPDILRTISAKKSQQVIVGFAAETSENLVAAQGEDGFKRRRHSLSQRCFWGRYLQ